MNYEAAMALDFNADRAVSPHAMTARHSAIAPYMSAATRILDVGSGTGRFAVLLAQWFGAPVFGIEAGQRNAQNGMRRRRASEGVLRLRAG